MPISAPTCAPPDIVRWTDRVPPQLATLLRRRDPFTDTGFEPGEQVWLHDCDAVYHRATYDYLLREGCGACVECECEGTWRRAVVPGAAPADVPADAKPAAEEPVSPSPSSLDDTPTISVSQARNHLGQMVILTGRVISVYVNDGDRPGSRTAFLLLEPGHRFSALTVVIFPETRALLARNGVDVGTLAGRVIGVHGSLERHEQYGPQIVLRDPRALVVAT